MASGAWGDLFAALALVLVLEGIVLALFSARLPGLIEQLRAIGPERARWIGLAMAVAGTVLHLLVRG